MGRVTDHLSPVFGNFYYKETIVPMNDDLAINQNIPICPYVKRPSSGAPDYYGSGACNVDCIQVIEASGVLAKEHHLASAFEHLWRAGRKEGNPIEDDVRKAKWFLERWLEVYG